jgi:branched-chain amino acid transport system ATP-binding protein
MGEEMSGNQETILRVENLLCSYGHIRALNGIDAEVAKGQIVTLIGNNGAGKSTALNSICRVLPALARTEGRVTFLSERIEKLPSDRIVRLGISQVPEGRRIFSELTVEENLLMGALLRGGRVEKDLEIVYDTFPILADRKRQPGGQLSGGEQQMLAIGRGLMAAPKLLILDEPSLGLAPLLVQEIFRIIRKINDRGTTILLVEQNARMALEIADRAYVIDKGRIVMQGRGHELLSDREVQRIYLGEN